MSTQPTDDEILAAAKAAGGYESPQYPENLVMDEHDLARFARAVLAKWGTPATGGEPVAYLIDWPDEPELGHYFAETPTQSGRSQPLYTSPQPVREPLNTVELMRVVMKADEESQDTRGTTNWAAHIGKAVQNAVLGITGGQHGTE